MCASKTALFYPTKNIFFAGTPCVKRARPLKVDARSIA